MIVLLETENRMIVSPFLWTKRRNVTDGRTDRDPLAITAVCMASNAADTVKSVWTGLDKL